MRLFPAAIVALVACAQTQSRDSAGARSSDQRIEVLLPLPPGAAVRSVQAAARDMDLPPGRLSGGVMRSEFSAGPYRLRSNQPVEVTLRATISAAGGMGQGSRVVVSGAERIVEGGTAAQDARPITRPPRGEESPTWDELERFAIAIRNHQ